MFQIPVTFSPLLALDVGGVIGLIVFTITIISWIAQALGAGKNAKAPPRQRMGNPARPLPEQLQEGIELFKKMVAEQQQTRQQQANPRSEAKAQPQQKRTTPPPIPAASTQTKGKKNKQQQSRKSAADKQANVLGENVSRRHIPVETDLRQHVVADAQKYLSKDSISDQVRDNMRNSVSAEVAAHFGGDQRSQGTSPQPTTPQILRSLLKNRQRISQAIIINEILQRPAALRNKQA